MHLLRVCFHVSCACVIAQVGSRTDLESMRQFLDDCDAGHVKIIAKIESLAVRGGSKVVVHASWGKVQCLACNKDLRCHGQSTG